MSQEEKQDFETIQEIKNDFEAIQKIKKLLKIAPLFLPGQNPCKEILLRESDICILGIKQKR